MPWKETRDGHPCELPRDDSRAVPGAEWYCDVCGDEWEVRFDIINGKHFHRLTTAEKLRRGLRSAFGG